MFHLLGGIFSQACGSDKERTYKGRKCEKPTHCFCTATAVAVTTGVAHGSFVLHVSTTASTSHNNSLNKLTSFGWRALKRHESCNIMLTHEQNTRLNKQNYVKITLKKQSQIRVTKQILQTVTIVRNQRKLTTAHQSQQFACLKYISHTQCDAAQVRSKRSSAYSTATKNQN